MPKSSLAYVLAIVLALTGCASNNAADNSHLFAENSVVKADSKTADISITTDSVSIEQEETTNVFNNSDKIYAVWTESEEIELEDAIASSNCIVLSKYVSYEATDDYVDYCFEPIEIYKGRVDGLVDGRFFVRWEKEYSDETDLKFAEGAYILPLKYVNSVYFDYPVYNDIGHYIIPCNADGGLEVISTGGITFNVPDQLTSEKEFVELAKLIEDTSEELFRDYISSSSLGDIISGSDFIAKAKISKEPLQSGSDRGIYTCELIQVYKGQIEQSFECVLKYDSVTVGEEYYLFLTKNSPDSKIYKISSKNSNYKSSDTRVLISLEENGLI